MNASMLLAAAVVASVVLSGCATFTPPAERPVIEEKLNRGLIDDTSAVGTLVLSPDRRVVLVSFKNERFCAEAPTEVGVDVSRLVDATASAKTKEAVEANLGLVMATTLSNAVLNKRTQGMMFLQNSAYFQCQMYMNDAITKEQLQAMWAETEKKAAELIKAEFEAFYKDPTPAKIADTINDAAKNVDEHKKKKAGAEGDTPKPEDPK